MRRLPRERMLDRAIVTGTAAADDVERIGRALANFYDNAVPHDLSADAYLRQLASAVHTGSAVLRDPAFDLPPEPIRRIDASLRQALRVASEMLKERAIADRIVEAHGDLRPEHVFLGPPVAVIDCLEFNRDLRMLDPVDELSFLAMECERRNAPQVGERLLAIYQEATGDRPPAALMDFYKALRALLRARLAIAHLRDNVVNPEHWRQQALSYIETGQLHAARLLQRAAL
jgi:aminoglycoside phosphotransferase family enzyme